MSTIRLHSKINTIASILEKNTNVSKINRTQLLADLYYLNQLIYKLYIIYNSDSHNKIKILRIASLKDPNGNKILNKKEAKVVLEYYGPKINNLYKKVYENQKKTLKKTQTGGKPILDHPKYAKNLKDMELAETEMLKWIDHFHQTYEKLIDRIPFKDLKQKIKDNKPILDNIFNWIFFPLWSLENLPGMGKFIEGQLDLMGVIIDNSDLILEFIAPFVPLLMDIGLDIGQAVPGYGSAISAVALPLNFAEGPIEYLIENGSDILGLYINLSRKQWGLAYISALEVIPNMTSFMDAFITNLVTANKWLNRINDNSELIVSNIELLNNTMTIISGSADKYMSLMNKVKDDPYLITQPDFILEDAILPIIDDVLIPNKEKIDFLKHVNIEEISVSIHNNLPKLKKILRNFDEYSKNTDLLYSELIKPNKDNIPIFKNIPDQKVKQILRDTTPILNKFKKDPMYYIFNVYELLDDLNVVYTNNFSDIDFLETNSNKSQLAESINPVLKKMNRFSKSVLKTMDR